MFSCLWLLQYLVLCLLLDCFYGFSACDEVDIFFLIDTDSVIKNSDGIIEFITFIIESGSSEHTGFSSIIYGNNIPMTNVMPIVTLHSTQTKLKREDKKRKMVEKLRLEFKNIKSVQIRREQTKSIGLTSAVKIANNQHHPKHDGDKKAKLGYNRNDNKIGKNDNKQIYIIFDDKNKLLTNSNNADICKLFHYLDTNQVQNENEAPYFMFGQKYSKTNIRDILCNGAKPYYISKNTFFTFNRKFVRNKRKMENIYDITCPAMIESAEYNGNINIGHNVQYIDLQTVIICNLYYYDHDNDKTTVDELDYKRSYIKIKTCNWFNNDNTFKIYDYLIATPKIIGSLKKKGCNAAVYKIIRIIQNEQIRDCKILSLFVKLPQSPMQYISAANVKGNILIHQQSKTTKFNKQQQRNQHAPEPSNNERRLIIKDELELDEQAIINGELNNYIIPNTFLEHLINNIALNRINRIKNVAIKAVKVRKMLNKLRRKYKQKRINIFGAKTLKEKNMMEFLGAVGRTIDDITHRVKGAANDVAKQVANNKKKAKKHKLERAARKKLINVKLKKKWTLIKTPKIQKMFGDKRAKGFSVTINGKGDIALKYGFWLTVKLGIHFNFYWQPLEDNVHFEVKLYGKWEIGADFNARYIGKLETLLNNVLNFGTREIIWIGPVPIATLKPYIIITAQMITLPHAVYAGFRCEYAEKFAFGYIYDKSDKIDKPINERKLLKKKCNKKLGVNGKHKHPANECPTNDFGFDCVISVKFGVSLYHILNTYIRKELMIPFRVQIPAMLPESCNAPKGTDMCSYKKHLMAGFSIALNLNIYVGGSFDVGMIINSVQRLFNRKYGKMHKTSKKEKKLTSYPIHIIPKMQLDCLELDGTMLSSLEQQFKSPCCGTSATQKEETSSSQGSLKQHIQSMRPSQTKPSQHIYIHILTTPNMYATNSLKYPGYGMRGNPQMPYGVNPYKQQRQFHKYMEPYYNVPMEHVSSHHAAAPVERPKYFHSSLHPKRRRKRHPHKVSRKYTSHPTAAPAEHSKYFDLSFHPKRHHYNIPKKYTFHPAAAPVDHSKYFDLSFHPKRHHYNIPKKHRYHH